MADSVWGLCSNGTETAIEITIFSKNRFELIGEGHFNPLSNTLIFDNQ